MRRRERTCLAIAVAMSCATALVGGVALANTPLPVPSRKWKQASERQAAKWKAPPPQKIQSVVKGSQTLPLPQRLVHLTDPFVGAPYAVSPLGEGEGLDKDPRLRFDRFDCTTFVETAIALAYSDDLDNTAKVLDAIRYRDGQPSFEGRRHFPEAEWIPELVSEGVLKDITKEVGGDAVVVEKKRIDTEVWDRRKRPSHLELPPERIPNGTFSLDVWPLDQARRHQEKIPSGTVLNLVRVDFKSVPVRVSHQGLIIEKDGAKFIRHAADRMFHRVVDEPLDYFLHRMQQYRKWPVAGINLLKVQPRKAREKKTAASAPATK